MTNPTKRGATISGVAKQAKLSVPSELPIAAHVDEICELLSTEQLIIVEGETGSGKTTQLPKIVATAVGLGSGLIGLTQPRRLAARGVAARLAVETGLVLGEGIGLQIRFEDNSSTAGQFKVMTDGILLNELAVDPLLRRYSALIIDEAHERSLNIDFLLGCLRRIIRKRSEFRVVITSATINTNAIAKFFGGAPVVSVSGRGYPVTHVYMPQAIGRGAEAHLLDALKHVTKKVRTGDVLVFLPGEREIKDAQRYLERHYLVDKGAAALWETLAVYGRLADSEQQKIFKPGKRRRIVLATNIAETSLTIPRIYAVIDSGWVRISRYSQRLRIQRLETEKVSRASAKQRAGRCGRLGPGLCLRLYSEEEMAAQAEFTDPEILRTHLANVLLRMKFMRLGDMEQFPWLDAPDQAQINDAAQLLREIGALDKHRGLTKIGRQLARLPIDPRLARVLVAAQERGVANDALIAVAGLSVADPRLRPDDARTAADRAHAKFADPLSDIQALLNLFLAWQAARKSLPRREHIEWVERHHLSIRRLFEWLDVWQQLKRQFKIGSEKTPPTLKATKAAITQSFLCGFVTQVGRREDDERFKGPRALTFRLHPSSSLASPPPDWILVIRLLKTSDTFGIAGMRIKPSWITHSARALLEYRYREPSWDVDSQRVMALETASLYGLVLHADQPVPATAANAKLARPVFLLHALARGEVDFGAGFQAQNMQLVTRIRRYEGLVRRDLLITEARLVELFDDLVPAGIFSVDGFREWLGAATNEQTEALMFTEATLISEAFQPPSDVELPEHVELAGNRVALRYVFNPESTDDGVSAVVPADLANAIKASEKDAAVPQYLRQRIEAHLRNLPKPQRRQLQPIRESVERIFRAMLIEHSDSPFRERLASQLGRHFGFDPTTLVWGALDDPNYLSLRLLIDNATAPSDQAMEGNTAPSREYIFEELPVEQALHRNGMTIPRWRALAAAGDQGVQLSDFSDQAVAKRSHRSALTHLFGLHCQAQLKLVRKALLAQRDLLLAMAHLPFARDLDGDFGLAVVQAVYAQIPFSSISGVDSFRSCLLEHRGDLVPLAEKALLPLSELAKELHSSASALAAIERGGYLQVDISEQLSCLIFPGFMQAHGLGKLRDLLRYVRAVNHRIEVHGRASGRDELACAVVRRFVKRYSELSEVLAATDAGREFFWLIQELRVSLFAEHLKTPVKISEKRLDKKWAALVGMKLT